MYSGDASVDEVGGGICQTSSTIYYAVLHTTLEIVERHAHMYSVGYVPDGMDATVYFGLSDFRFKNNTDYPVKIVTESYDKNGLRYLTVKLYGTNVDGRYAVPERTQFDFVSPTTQYRADESIPQGTTKVDAKQNAYTGRSAAPGVSSMRRTAPWWRSRIWESAPIRCAPPPSSTIPLTAIPPLGRRGPPQARHPARDRDRNRVRGRHRR